MIPEGESAENRERKEIGGMWWEEICLPKPWNNCDPGKKPSPLRASVSSTFICQIKKVDWILLKVLSVLPVLIVLLT